jgi:hypothetical protein
MNFFDSETSRRTRFTFAPASTAGRHVRHGSAGIEQHGRLGHLEAHALELVDHLTKGLAARRERRGHVEGRPRRADRHGRRAQPLGIIIVLKTA